MSPWLWKEQKISRIIEAPFIHQFSEWMQTGALFYTYTKPQTLQTRIARLFVQNRRSFSCKPRPDLWNFRLYPLWSWAFASSGWMMLWFFYFFPSEVLAKLFHIIRTVMFWHRHGRHSHCHSLHACTRAFACPRSPPLFSAIRAQPSGERHVCLLWKVQR